MVILYLNLFRISTFAFRISIAVFDRNHYGPSHHRYIDFPDPATGPRGWRNRRGRCAEGGPSFKDFLVQSIQDVNSMQAAADKAVEKLATGGDVNPAEVLTAVQKADIAFQMMIQVRNKLVDAFTEIKNMQI